MPGAPCEYAGLSAASAVLVPNLREYPRASIGLGGCALTLQGFRAGRKAAVEPVASPALIAGAWQGVPALVRGTAPSRNCRITGAFPCRHPSVTRTRNRGLAWASCPEPGLIRFTSARKPTPLPSSKKGGSGSARGGVDALRQRYERYAQHLEILEQHHQVAEAATKSVKTPDDQGVISGGAWHREHHRRRESGLPWGIRG